MRSLLVHLAYARWPPQLDQVVYQLHTVSFFLAPALLPFLARVLFQFQFAKPRDIDPGRSLRFWFMLVLVFNVGSVWAHATETAAQAAQQSIILDFVGPGAQALRRHDSFIAGANRSRAHCVWWTGAPPSRLQLLLLDLAIIVLDMVLVFISYEDALHEASPKDSADPLAPIPPASVPSTPELDFPIASPSASPSASSTSLPLGYQYPPKPPSHTDPQTPYVLDLRLSAIYRRLRDPAPPAPERAPDDLLPMPNTTAFQLTGTLRVLLQARTRARNQMEERRRRKREQEERGRRQRTRIPGGLDIEGEDDS